MNLSPPAGSGPCNDRPLGCLGIDLPARAGGDNKTTGLAGSATADQLLHAAQACEATVAVLDSELLPDHAVTELAQQLLLVPTRLLLTTWDPSYSVSSSSRPSSPVLRKPFSIQTLLTSLELCGRGNQ